jgi:hypothetical protein
MTSSCPKTLGSPKLWTTQIRGKVTDRHGEIITWYRRSPICEAQNDTPLWSETDRKAPAKGLQGECELGEILTLKSIFNINLIYSLMTGRHDSLCRSADSSYKKTDAERPTASQILKPSCSARYPLSFIILLYVLTVLGLILHDHGVSAGKEYRNIFGIITHDNFP